MQNGASIGRRSFLKLMGTSLAGFPFFLSSLKKPDNQSGQFPSIYWDDIPTQTQEIIQRIPEVEIRPNGLLWIWDQNHRAFHQSPLAQTQWNFERYNSYERLFRDKSWGIVLHWFGKTFNGEQSLAGYLRGFDGLRKVGSYQTRTSAHFLVGSAAVNQSDEPPSNIGIVQTQLPDIDGVPLVASHLSGLDYEAHQQKQQYFVRAFYELGYADPSIHSILTEIYDGPKLDPNYRTIAIEMTGSNFDQDGNAPSSQQLANVIGLIYALMLRYHITALDILGHHEIELRKPDPGKKFMAFIRYIIGIYALYAKDAEFFQLVFGNFLTYDQDPWTAVRRYFKFVRDYFVFVGNPDQIYRWESSVDYWNWMNSLNNKGLIRSNNLQAFHKFGPILKTKTAVKKNSYLSPSWHEGIDLYLENNPEPYNPVKKIEVFLPARGQCLQVSGNSGCGFGHQVIFRHIQTDGAEIISIFSNLENIQPLKKGEYFDAGYSIGTIAAGGPLGEGFLHFAIAYGATWDSFLQHRAILPSDVSADWIQRRYIDPETYLMSPQTGDKSGS